MAIDTNNSISAGNSHSIQSSRVDTLTKQNKKELERSCVEKVRPYILELIDWRDKSQNSTSMVG